MRHTILACRLHTALTCIAAVALTSLASCGSSTKTASDPATAQAANQSSQPTSQSGSQPTSQAAATSSAAGGPCGYATVAQLQDPTKFGYAKTGLPTAVDVPGVGDSAFYLPQTTSVNLLKGSKSPLVQAVFTNRPDPAKIKAEVIAVAGNL